ncbi:type I-C CRISPR-associated endonuclease Cas1c [Brevibacillus agri]|uniref:type I-C CRISPR-associated endonuclease Cas1c n=1 Tax=Brevibacillus agri TaxID=51101 RepID=UPI002E21FAF6|nr:type I-C CRISPR-associated endonuclease Cas1c [Brevibacillus agri]MED4571329.1 type I-C CRISPR-associated endonuclease Cas1c [Brevibacillus agri]
MIGSFAMRCMVDWHRADGAKELQVPRIQLESIVIFGYVGVSPEAMNLCVDNGISLVFLTPTGRFKARVTGEVSGNIHLRRTQYRCCDREEQSLLLAKRFVYSKLVNARVSVKRTLRDYAERIQAEQCQSVVTWLDRQMREVVKAKSLDELRGIEGLAARHYFSVLPEQILANKEDFAFRGRVKRPPRDRVNALLSFLYTLLANDVTHALETVGLDPQAGYLHRDRPGRNGLALDLMEEFRVYMADRTALTLINRKQVTKDDFVEKESGAFILNDEARKLVLTEWQQRKRDEIYHPFFEEKIAVGLLPYAQAMLLARYMRGDLDDYPPFFGSRVMWDDGVDYLRCKYNLCRRAKTVEAGCQNMRKLRPASAEFGV